MVPFPKRGEKLKAIVDDVYSDLIRFYYGQMYILVALIGLKLTMKTKSINEAMKCLTHLRGTTGKVEVGPVYLKKH